MLSPIIFGVAISRHSNNKCEWTSSFVQEPTVRLWGEGLHTTMTQKEKKLIKKEEWEDRERKEENKGWIKGGRKNELKGGGGKNSTDLDSN